jgi:peptide/nickel transport system permease protein
VTARSARAGAALFGAIVLAAIAAPVLIVNPPEQQFPGYVQAPPMRPHLRGDDGRWQRPFVYPLRLVDRLERRFVEDRSRRVALRWFAGGRLLSADPAEGPWLPLGGDVLGRDVYSRLLLGSRLSLGVALLATAGALALGALVGAIAGFAGGRLETLLMALADFVIVLPAIYVVVALRAAMPLVLSTGIIFWATAAILALAGWPFAARGVRAIVAVEKKKEYAESARAVGATPWQILHRHLLPAAGGFLVAQGILLVPAFVLAEATLSLVGLGFSEPASSWGGMLREAGRGRAFAEAPWLLAPAAAIAATLMALQMLGSGLGDDGSRRVPNPRRL